MKKLKKISILSSVFIGLFSSMAFSQGISQPSPATLDRGLKPQATDEVTSLFENIVAVQRKAKVKTGKFIFFPAANIDFSDAPNTMYGARLAFGYAVSEFFEVYLAAVPAYVASERNISKLVRQQVDQNGNPLSLNSEKAKSSFGIDLNWIPIYGKDSWGPYGIIRSDTFFNFGINSIKYEKSSGLQGKIMIGKTFFISNWFNLRLQAGPTYLETFSQNADQVTSKQSIVTGLLEAGVSFYF